MLRRRIRLTVASLLGSALVAIAGCGGSGSGGGTGSTPATTNTQAAQAPQAQSQAPSSLRSAGTSEALPTPISGEAVVAGRDGLLVIGGVDSGDVSTATVLRLGSDGGAAKPAGTLAQALHDVAAASLPSGTLVFGGGSAATTDEVERLVPGGTAQVIGHMPQARSDLSVVGSGGRAYVVGGYDGTSTVGAVLSTGDGQSFQPVADLPVAVRYPGVAYLDGAIWVLGGEQADGSDTDAIQRVDPRSGVATVAGHLPGTLAHPSVAVLGGTLFLLGGRLDGSTTAQIYRFDPASAQVKPAGTLPSPIQNAAAAAYGGSIFLVGGLSAAGSPVSDVVRLGPVPGGASG